MAKEYYNRYGQFNIDGKYKMLPFIKIEPKSSDKTIVWKLQRDRMDKLSQEYYGNPYHGWLIMLANPKYGGLEDNITEKDICNLIEQLNLDRSINGILVQLPIPKHLNESLIQR